MIDRFRLHHFDVLNSTQIEAEKTQYQAGDIVIAATQTGSYGRRGRAWQAPIGNLYYTMVEDYENPSQLEYLPYVFGLALYDAAAACVSDAALLKVKWPNDVLLDGKKISGILIEIRDARFIIGIGVNIAIRPETDQPATCLQDYATETVDKDRFLAVFLHHYTKWLERAKTGGFAAIRKDWLARAAFKGEIIHAKLANGTVLSGRFDDLDAHGALVLQGEKAHHVVTSADIFFNHSELGSRKTNND